MATRAFENPLIPHARMRAMYRAMVHVRALAPHLPRALRLPRHQEACFVAAAIGLEAGDLTSSSPLEPVLQFIRQAAQTERAKAAGLLQQQAPALSLHAAEQLLLAAGQAMALQQNASGAAALAFAAADALNAAEWQRVLSLVASAVLPLVLVVLPSTKVAASDFTRLAAKAGSNLAVLPVDASDPLALYRVAQESLGRARAGGGPALLECVASAADPIRLLADQMLARRITTAAWLAAVEPRFQVLLSAPARIGRKQLH